MDGSCNEDRKSASDMVQVIQSMIDVYSERLEGLRTQCATSVELTQQEIRTLEGKLIKLFSEQLATKAKCNSDQMYKFKNIPSLPQWLRVVGLSANSVQTVCDKITSVEALKEKSDHELRAILCSARDEEVHRLCRAMLILKKYTEHLLRGENTGSDMALHWDSWDRHQPRSSPRPARASLTIEKVSTPSKLSVSSIEAPPLTKSRSHESQLQKHNDDLSDTSQSSTVHTSEPCSPPISESSNHEEHSSDHLFHNFTRTKQRGSKVVYSTRSGNKSESKSGSSAHSMKHTIRHVFERRFHMISTCDYCGKQIYFGTGLKCRECKYKCHRECEPKVAPSCGLSQELIDVFFTKVHKEDTYTPPRKPEHRSGEASPAAASCGSPAPSSVSSVSGGVVPLLNNVPSASPQTAPSTTHPQHSNNHFHFPELTSSNSSIKTLVNNSKSKTSDSDRTVSLSGSNSTDSARADSVEDNRWPRQNSLSMKEWDIPYNELKLLEPVGTGRFGTVHRGLWHGAVAVKVLNVQYDNDALQAFKQEVATFRKTRHENLVLFMGACMEPQKLAIVTSLCRGNTLYTLIHQRRDKFNANKCVIIAQQIAHGMGYLHGRGIIHKDLKTKNIFLDSNNKVVITDFGLFSVTKLCFSHNGQTDRLGIPAGWLYYLAPELMRSLRVQNDHHELPFSTHTDVYAFGTVWYELLTGEWPFRSQPPESVIWQVGRGVKQPLRDLNASREVKEILVSCWQFSGERRLDFSQLRAALERLPRKRLARSPSHPLHLSRSAESVF